MPVSANKHAQMEVLYMYNIQIYKLVRTNDTKEPIPSSEEKVIKKGGGRKR